MNTETPGPRSLRELFVAFNSLALKGFGGVLPVAQHELVEARGWLTREQFVELLSLAQVLPGPNIVNLSLMFGERHFGWRGALAALAGMIVAPLAIVLLLAVAYREFAQAPVVAGAMRGMGIASAGLVAATGWRLLAGLKRNPLGRLAVLGLIAAVFATVAIARWPLVWVVLTLGSVGMALAWRRQS